ncbi:photosystem II assembly protein Psb34 [Synechococcus elongatus]|uniref:Ssl1498 family light-harvesting-like protein n=1 Tax=Synechococcus elongatus PCC 11802 TaxID=2283154 RepID=A0AAT9JX22_SYNEL|nr:ssl1498 family light-harvesting-like protein [Synechococcus elongatus]QFZ90980.1 ssl1498 family light-harvesting-like protein [Synechococcus elongatus PCC 11802]
MPYTTEEGGRLNNFAKEPKMYQAEASPDQGKKWLWTAGAALLLIAGLLVIAVSASH